jgi:hypothetical protein
MTRLKPGDTSTIDPADGRLLGLPGALAGHFGVCARARGRRADGVSGAWLEREQGVLEVGCVCHRR